MHEPRCAMRVQGTSCASGASSLRINDQQAVFFNPAATRRDAPGSFEREHRSRPSRRGCDANAEETCKGEASGEKIAKPHEYWWKCSLKQLRGRVKRPPGQRTSETTSLLSSRLSSRASLQPSSLPWSYSPFDVSSICNATLLQLVECIELFKSEVKKKTKEEM